MGKLETLELRPSWVKRVQIGLKRSFTHFFTMGEKAVGLELLRVLYGAFTPSGNRSGSGSRTKSWTSHRVHTKIGGSGTKKQVPELRNTWFFDENQPSCSISQLLQLVTGVIKSILFFNLKCQSALPKMKLVNPLCLVSPYLWIFRFSNGPSWSKYGLNGAKFSKSFLYFSYISFPKIGFQHPS